MTRFQKSNLNTEITDQLYEYKYFGKWCVYDEETDEILRTEKKNFSVICKYPPEVWNKMENERTDEYVDIISESYGEVYVDLEPETEYTYRKWHQRVDNEIKRHFEHLINQIEGKGYSYDIRSGDSPFRFWDEDLGLTKHELEIFIWDDDNEEDEFTLYCWEVLSLDEGDCMCFDEGEPLSYCEYRQNGLMTEIYLNDKEEIDIHLSKNLKKFNKEHLVGGR